MFGLWIRQQEAVDHICGTLLLFFFSHIFYDSNQYNDVNHRMIVFSYQLMCFLIGHFVLFWKNKSIKHFLFKLSFHFIIFPFCMYIIFHLFSPFFFLGSKWPTDTFIL